MVRNGPEMAKKHTKKHQNDQISLQNDLAVAEGTKGCTAKRLQLSMQIARLSRSPPLNRPQQKGSSCALLLARSDFPARFGPLSLLPFFALAST
jgi:hypothetical protein